MVRFLRLARKAGWAITDQGMYALSNLVVSIILARLLYRERFGAYATAFLIFSIAVAVERAIVGQPLQIKLSGSTDEVFRSALRGAMGTAVLIGLVGSAVCLTVWQVGQDVLGPVSYTHLDVYKRQACNWRMRPRAIAASPWRAPPSCLLHAAPLRRPAAPAADPPAALAGRGPCLRRRHRTVSYTHLDVYKRQQ